MLSINSKRLRLILLIRSLFIQAYWNYHNLQAIGLAFILESVKKYMNFGGEETEKAFNLRNLAFFNGHPYFVGIPAGVIAKKEIEDQGNAQFKESLAKFREAIASPLGAIGDTLFWSTTRPLVLLFPIYIFLAGGSDLMMLFSLIASLLIYNIFQLKTRWWAFSNGLEMGYEVYRVFNMRHFEKQIAILEKTLYILLFGTLAATIMFLAKTDISMGLTLSSLIIIMSFLRMIIKNQILLLFLGLILMWICGRLFLG